MHIPPLADACVDVVPALNNTQVLSAIYPQTHRMLTLADVDLATLTTWQIGRAESIPVIEDEEITDDGDDTYY